MSSSNWYLQQSPNRVALDPADQLHCTPVSRFVFTFWNKVPPNSWPSLMSKKYYMLIYKKKEYQKEVKTIHVGMKREIVCDVTNREIVASQL